MQKVCLFLYLLENKKVDWLAGSLTLQRYVKNFQKGLAFLDETFKKSKDGCGKFKIVNVYSKFIRKFYIF